MISYIFIGIILVIIGIGIAFLTNYSHSFFCGWMVMIVGIILFGFGIFSFETNNPTTTYYLEAEPLAYNYETNLTYFTSAEGQFKAEGIYPENTYLLTMDNNGTSNKEDDIVLVVWEPSEGEVG